MFYFLASKFITPGSSLKIIFLIGTICYIILHAYLFGNGASETTRRFRSYIYYLFVVDAALTGSYIWLFGSNNKVADAESESDPHADRDADRDADRNADQDADHTPPLPDNIRQQLEQGGQQPNIEEIHRKLLELKARQELKLKKDQVQEPVNHPNSGTKVQGSAAGSAGPAAGSATGSATGSSSRSVSGTANSSANESRGNESPFARKDEVQSRQKVAKIKYQDDSGERNDENDNGENNNSYRSKGSKGSIPLFLSENNQSDTDIPLYVAY
jgi:hypothetical protein